MLLSLAILAGSIYSYGKVDSLELETIETQIIYAEGNSDRRRAWIILNTEDRVSFYCPDDLLDMGTSGETAEWILEKCGDKTVTVCYTSRRDLLPVNILIYIDYERMVSLNVRKKKSCPLRLTI